MTLSGKLLAELAWVAQRDADAVGGDRYAWPPPPPLTPEQRVESDRLRVLADRLAYKARERGFVDMGGDALFGGGPCT